MWVRLATEPFQCDGTRPQCARCSELDLTCQYDVAEGVSRAERMKILKRDGISTRADEMERVIRALRTTSDAEAATILARLRIGERVDDLAKSLPPFLSSPVPTKPPRYASPDPNPSTRHGMITWL